MFISGDKLGTIRQLPNHLELCNFEHHHAKGTAGTNLGSEYTFLLVLITPQYQLFSMKHNTSLKCLLYHKASWLRLLALSAMPLTKIQPMLHKWESIYQDSIL
jgi:hypothetical protein